jgi:hypothetical protein
VKRAPLLLVGLLLAGAACAQVIGIEHYQAVVAQGGAQAWACLVETSVTGAACVDYTPGPDGGEGDPQLDDGGVAAVTTCNPVTNMGCTGTDVCVPDADDADYYCAPGPASPAPLCAACPNGDECGPGNVCVPSAAGPICMQWCCDDSDCGPGVCDMSIAGSFGGDLGVCVQ